jgi:predicted aspartyl protease
MGRIITSIKISNLTDQAKTLSCDALVDTGATYTVLPLAWKDRLGDLEVIEAVEMETATQQTIYGDICGPVRIQIEGFRPIYSEVVFIDMKPDNGRYEPLVGYTTLELSHAAVDMLGHRLLPVKKVDLK